MSSIRCSVYRLTGVIIICLIMLLTSSCGSGGDSLTPRLVGFVQKTSTSSITIYGTAICGNRGGGSPCASVTIAGISSTPNPQLGPDWGKFSISGVNVATDGTGTEIVYADSPAGIAGPAVHCDSSFSIPENPGISLGLGVFSNGSGPWSVVGQCNTPVA
jgi:hypothetical protein